jgi:hypothetical protein
MIHAIKSKKYIQEFGWEAPVDLLRYVGNISEDNGR